jgi:type III pantothenate kinase
MEARLDEAISQVRNAGHGIDRAGVASVVPDSAACLTRLLKDRGYPTVQVHSSMRLPFRLDTASPETLGIDRLAATAAAWVEYGKSSEHGDPRHVIVLDAGSAVTCEVVHRSGVYAGGTIGPGPELALNALHRGTAQLPDMVPEWPDILVGRSTTEAMQSGIMYGFVEGVRGLLRRIRETLQGETFAVATGGWSYLFAEQAPEIDRTDEYLVLKGVRLLMALNETDAE